MLTLIQSVLTGGMVGGLYAIMSVGLTLTFGVVRIVNFAHGAFVMMASYLAWLAYKNWGMDPFVAAIPITALFLVIGIGFYVGFLQRLSRFDTLAQVLFTVAIAFVLQGFATGQWGPDPQVVAPSYSLDVVHIGSISLPLIRIIAFAIGLAATAALWLLLTYTDFGRSVRASVADRGAAQMIGIKPSRVQAITTGIGVACAGLAGAILAPISSVSPTVYTDYTFIAFIVIILGGLGSFFGAFFGGLIIGITEALGQTYLDGGIAHALTFGMFIVIVVVRPNGLAVRRTA